MHDKNRDKQINGTQSNDPFEAIDLEEPFVYDDQSTLLLLEMNTGIHGFFYHRDEMAAIDAAFTDFAELRPYEFESQPSTTKKPKSLDSTDTLEDNPINVPTLSFSSTNSDPTH